jgi:hypothetical protein
MTRTTIAMLLLSATLAQSQSINPAEFLSMAAIIPAAATAS